MPSYIFSQQISLSGASDPVNLTYSTSFSALSAPGGTGAIAWIGRGGTAVSTLFNTPSTAFTPSYAQITANGQTYVVNSAFQNTVMSVVSADGTATVFTCLTAAGAQTVTQNGYDSVSPDRLRKRNLGYN